MNETFSGWTLRFGVQNRETPSFVNDAIYFAPEYGEGLDICEYLFRKTNSVLADTYRFQDLDKLRVEMVYHRFIPASTASSDFIAHYVGSGEQVTADTHRGNTENRRRELDMHRGARAIVARERYGEPDPTIGDPWYAVETAYEFHRARAIVRVAHGYDESVWFASTGPEDDVAGRFDAAIQEHVTSVRGELLTVVGPYPAGGVAHPGAGMVFAVSRLELGDLDEYARRFITHTRWQD